MCRAALPRDGLFSRRAPGKPRPLLLRKLALTILIQVNGHRLRHDVSIKAHLEGKVATVRIASGGVLQIGGSSCIVDNLFAVQPATNHAVSLRSETHLKAQVEPFAAKISLLLVEDDELVVEILCDSENAAGRNAST